MEFVNPHFLVDVEWLADNLYDPGVRVVDVTSRLTADLTNQAKEKCFDLGHIPGSVHLDVGSAHGALSDPEQTLAWMWPSNAQVERVLGEIGVTNGTRVILVARTPRAGLDSGTMWCTRAWWTLHHLGVDCAILHGGIEAWEAAGHELSTDQPSITPTKFTIAGEATATAARVNADQVLAALGDTATCVVDALPEGRYQGVDPGYGPRRGHITGAVNVPYPRLITAETAAFAAPDVLAEILGEAGLLDQQRVITYCGGAIAATVDAFVLKLFGHPQVSVYDGSLMEWSARDDLPMTNPSEAGS